MDFLNDIIVINLNDQYMFGFGLLVSLVYEEGVIICDVYLFEGMGWFDFYIGKIYQGGQIVIVDVLLLWMLLFVKVGIILFIGLVI